MPCGGQGASTLSWVLQSSMICHWDNSWVGHKLACIHEANIMYTGNVIPHLFIVRLMLLRTQAWEAGRRHVAFMVHLEFSSFDGTSIRMCSHLQYPETFQHLPWVYLIGDCMLYCRPA